MGDVVIRVENVSKEYRLGVIGYGTLSNDLQSRWARFWKKEDPNSKIDHSVINSELNERFWALKNVSFDVNRGEIVGIIGKNGAGKSTLLKILSRVTSPTTGSVKVKGRIASLLEVGTGFHPELTGRENVFLNGAILGMTKREVGEKFDEIVRFAEIEKFIDTPVKRYSSGMYVRLAFAVAAHLEPEILVVDEVLAVGDIQYQKKCLSKMNDISKEGRTIIYVSHNMRSIIDLCQICILIDKGEIIKIGKNDDIIGLYLSINTTKSGINDLTNISIRKNSLCDSLFKWKKIELINSNKIKTAVIKWGEPFCIKIIGKLRAPVSNLTLGFSIDSVLGFPMFNSSISVSYSLDNYPPSGEITVFIKLDQNYLAPGLYTISLGARGNKIIDWIPEAIQLQIDHLSINGAYLNPNYGGVIIHPCIWEVSNGLIVM